MRRLYLQIYLAFLGILLLFALLVTTTWWTLRDTPQSRAVLAGYATLLGDALPAASTSATTMQAALTRIGTLTHSRITLRSPGGELIAAHGEALPAAPPGLQESDFVHLRGVGPTVALRLADGRWVLGQWRRQRSASGWLLAVGLLLACAAAGAYPLTRRITGRLERLRSRVEALGAGDLSARVEVEGRDEVAQLAIRFNQAAQRIQQLVAAQRSMLAGASHELRSPLARLRVALELLPTKERPELARQIARDIGELDALIDELLLASRLDAGDSPGADEAVELLALVAEEAARHGALVAGTPATISGDARLLRRLTRNLLDNARRHGAGNAVEISVMPSAGGALLRVADRGPGVPEVERERIFEPFYRPAGSRDGPQGGVGLGLALVRRIACRHGGDVACLPREGGGVIFEVRLGGSGPPTGASPRPTQVL